ncbi:MAG TPA: aldehyde dehydrogenase family protein, partial [Chiayiivirga sp.]|nr:aldehyde dehydrogenase family protein [Chiayiivirga sp.]
MKSQVLIGGGWRDADVVGTFRAVDPTSGQAIGDAFPISSCADLDEALTAACAVASELAATAPETIASFLAAYADGIEAHSEALASLAHQETGLP